MSKRRYITTAIDYPNAAPHMGHVLEKVLADTVARWSRLRGGDVRFQIGTDEHGIKIQQTAEKEGVTPEVLVDRNVPLFEDLYSRMGISADVFVRTSDRKISWPNAVPVYHRPTVEALWKALQKAGALEKRTYTGLYCSGCERFVTKKDLVDGKCPDHQRVPEEVKEENWFFLLSREAGWLKELLSKKGGYTIVPSFRAPETLSLIEQGLEDVSFSRPKSSLSWGIPVPEDENQTMYVWCDALTNYISSLGLFTDTADANWWNDAEVTHVIGKDIARFHALIWPAMLKYAGVKTPDRLLIHGFLTSEGQKMSKSLGNVVVPDDVIGTYGVDALRFYLCHEIPVGNDGDFSWKNFTATYDGFLRDQLGNLLNRVMVLLKKEGGGLMTVSSAKGADEVGALWQMYAARADAFEMHASVQAVAEFVRALNVSMQQQQPWKLQGEEKASVLSFFAESLRHVSLLLLPFIPETARKISTQLGVPYAETMLEKSFVITEELKRWGGVQGWKKVGDPQILFPPIDKHPK